MGTLAQTPMTPSMPPVSSYKLLSEDKNIRLTYEVRILPAVSNQILVSVLFHNISDCHLKDMELSIIETLNTRVVYHGTDENGDGTIKVPFQLPPSAVNEIQSIFSVDSILSPQKLRGTFTYIMMMDTNSTHEKIDFKLHLPVSSYMVGMMHKRDAFTELLSSSDIAATSSITLDSMDIEFTHILAKICFHCHFSVVEQLGLSASLYSRSIKDDHVCLLVKLLNSSRVGIEAKGTNLSLVSSLLEEIKSVFCPQMENIP